MVGLHVNHEACGRLMWWQFLGNSAKLNTRAFNSAAVVLGCCLIRRYQRERAENMLVASKTWAPLAHSFSLQLSIDNW